MLARAFPSPTLPPGPRPTSALVYFPAPERDFRLTRADLRVWLALARRGAMDAWLEFSPSRLAPDLEMTRNAVFSALRHLTTMGYLERGRHGRLTRVRCVPAPASRRGH